jgi:hypothetical protein
MKRYILLAALLLSACAPSAKAIQTAIAQTQIAAPTNTIIPPTEIPTETPTVPPSPTPSPTPDLRIIGTTENPSNFLLALSDLPAEGSYSLPGTGWIGKLHNSQIIQEYGAEAGNKYVNETGRVDGWWVTYKRGSSAGIYPQQIYDNVILFQTSAGAQLMLAKYADPNSPVGAKTNFTEIQGSKTIGDLSKVLIKKDSEHVWYDIVFTYRNYGHVVEAYGLASEVQPEFVESIADILLKELQSAPLSVP